MYVLIEFANYAGILVCRWIRYQQGQLLLLLLLFLIWECAIRFVIIRLIPAKLSTGVNKTIFQSALTRLCLSLSLSSYAAHTFLLIIWYKFIQFNRSRRTTGIRCSAWLPTFRTNATCRQIPVIWSKPQWQKIAINWRIASLPNSHGMWFQKYMHLISNRNAEYNEILNFMDDVHCIGVW